ncbi:unnamed protein product [Bursaphelenchus okinawaensis]|uniref:tRNA-uridine aminocarboxypropyltransferase 1 n=1 Tax=Bursaphelenchus okinawaensis TaxID=465554 RepID=A0A811LSP6_9BILA|nr:unnamed protein product [Bursaphelenchus okinawaensis]CAG9127888.1 unnamed protein product [Bursaphelenchus okinawaensis]
MALGTQEDQFEAVKQMKQRQDCPKCAKKRLYFCYDCLIYMPGVEKIVPDAIELPVHIEIIKHPAEKAAKSTATHCSLIAPSSTSFHHFPCPELPPFDPKTSAVVFPSSSALPIDEYLKKNPGLERLIMLDSTWNAVSQLKNMPQLKGVPCVMLNRYETEYWRPQKNYNDECLATIEAIYYAVREVHASKYPLDVYDGRYEPLLFWFKFFKKQFVDQSIGMKRVPGLNGEGKGKKNIVIE